MSRLLRHAVQGGLAALLLVPARIAAQEDPVPNPAHAVESPRPLLTRADAAWFAGFAGVSALISARDPAIARFFSDTTLGHVRSGRDWAQVFTRLNETTLTAGGLLAYGVGRAMRSHTLADVALHTTESIVLASLASQAIRGPLGRSRPHVTDYEDQYDFHPFRGFGQFRYRAFPSIHTSSAFAAATALVLETHHRAPTATPYVAPVAYTLAATPALARMYMGQHWASDIVMGAFMGTMAGARVVGYMHAHPDNAIDRRLLPVVSVGADDSAMLGLSWTF